MPSPALTLHLFGPLQVLVDGEPMPRVRARSTEWLLALLALRYGHTVDRGWLAGTLWPESEQRQGLHNLRNALVELRRGLGREGGRLRSPARDTLTLDLEAAEVDVVRFDAALKAADEAALEVAVALYTGPLLEGCYEAWVLPERESREQFCLQALDTLAERAAERGDHAAAIPHLRKAEALDPLRDSTARRLMTALEATGDPAAAIEVYRRLRQRLHETLSGTPDETTTQLFQGIQARARQRAGQKVRAPGAAEPAAAPGPPPTPLYPVGGPPHPITRIIGREQEVEEVRERLKQSRLVTLIGAGGVGKTRLAIEVAALATEELRDGAVWVELAPLVEGALLLPTLAGALGVRQEGVSDPETLLDRLVSHLARGQFLLALDNCEHLLDDTAAAVERLLSRCPDLRVLTTSRQRLGVTGEVAWRVPSLPVPGLEPLPADPREAGTTALAFPAIQLFVERASSVHGGFQLTRREEVEAVCRICRRLDGIPLAIELAAARIGSLAPQDIDARLNQRFRLLRGGSRAALPRQQTLKSLIDWSYDLLSEAEQALFRRLSVFSGGWRLEAAETVCADDLVPEWETVDLLSDLVDKAMVVAEASGASVRYRLLETMRQYAVDRLAESGEPEVWRHRHRDFYLQFAEEVEPRLYGPDQGIWYDCRCVPGAAVQRSPGPGRSGTVAALPAGPKTNSTR